MKNMTIGKMARLNGISEQTLRLYDKMQLLMPCEVNEATGYRYYNIKQCAQLDMILYLKALGMNLNEIKVCLQGRKIEGLKSALEQHKSNIERKAEELAYMQKAIERALENHRRYEVIPPDGAIVREYQMARRVFKYDTETNLYSYGMDYYEKILRLLKQNYNLNKLPASYFCNVGSIMRKEYFMRRELYATEVIIFVDNSFESGGNIEIIPEAVYICTYCNGYPGEEESLKMLMDYILACDYEVIGDCISEVLVEFPAFANYDRNAFFKLQIPVKKR